MHTSISMFGLNWVDAIVIVLLILAAVEGVRVGFVTQMFAISGFFITLFVAGWLLPHLLPIHDQTIRTIVNGGLVLTIAAYAAMRSYDVGQHVHWSFRTGKRLEHPNYKVIEASFGVLPGLLAGLVLTWLLGVALGRLPFAGLSNSVTDARIVQMLTRSMPPVPAVFAQFDRQVNPNSQPYVYTSPLPSTNFNYSRADVQQAAAYANASVVRITSFGCGGIVSGTGFVVGQGLVATNAHVVAGIKRSIVKYGGRSYETKPVLFDPILDLSILRVDGLTAPSLMLDTSSVADDTTVAILGYPGGNYRITPGIIRDTLAVSASSIYDQGTAGRGIYNLQATVDYGNSGGPVVLVSGKVAGILFSKSTTVSNQAYALTSSYISSALGKARASYRSVGTGACMVN